MKHFLRESEIRDRAIRSLQELSAFSLVRVSDGEGLLLGFDQHSPEMALEFRKQYQQWFGVDPPGNTALVTLRERLLVSLEAADLVGVHDRVDGDPVRQFSIEQFDRFCGSISRDVVSSNCHLRLQRSGRLREIIDEAASVCLVTCRPEVAERFAHLSGKVVSVISVPADTRTETQPYARSGDTGHLQNFARIRKECSGHGMSLTLVGAGVLGKSYTIAAARGGSVALDVGSLFDGWAGLLTRGHLKPDPAVYSLEALFS